MFLVVLLRSSVAAAVTVAWDRSPEPDVTGYVISYGSQPRALRPYDVTIDVGNVTQWTFTPPSNLTPYYFAVRAKDQDGLISPYSNEVLLEPSGRLAAPTGADDFNSDGSLDLIWQNDVNGLVAAWFMSGPNRVGGQEITQAGDTAWKIVGYGDFNGDGYSDIFWQHQVTRLMFIWYMNDARLVGAASLEQHTVGDTAWEIRAIGDMTGDGRPDLVWQNRRDGYVVVWEMRGPDRVTGYVVGSVGDSRWLIAGAGDFDADDDLDFVWQHQATGEITLWYMNGLTYDGGRSVYPTGIVSDLDWRIVAAKDLSGDGRADLIWQHRKNGSLVMWRMNGAALMSGVSLNPPQVSDLSWRIAGPR